MTTRTKIKRIFTLSALTACAFAACSTANAAGFQLTEQSVVGMGRAHAGAGIVGDDLSAVHYNAAGMTLLKGTQFGLATTAVDLDIDYRGEDGATENGRDRPAPVPAMYITHQLNNSVFLGFGITSPYGMKLRYNEDWSQRGRGISGSILTIDFNPNIAWKMNPYLSVGGGVSAMYTHSKVKLGLPLGGNSQFEFKGDDWMFTYNLGLMFTPYENLRFGLSYRSRANVNAKGDYSIRTPRISGTVDGSGRLRTPETVMLTATWEPIQNLRLSALGRWANWKNFDTMTFAADDAGDLGPLAALGMVQIPNNWKAVWLLSTGADYKISEKWTIRGGIAYETSPISQPELRTALIPDTERLWLTAGLSWMPTKNLQLDAAYGHIRGIGERDLYNSLHQKVGRFKSMNAWLGGVSMTYRF